MSCMYSSEIVQLLPREKMLSTKRRDWYVAWSQRKQKGSESIKWQVKKASCAEGFKQYSVKVITIWKSVSNN